jgi:hypothetical protein
MKIYLIALLFLWSPATRRVQGPVHPVLQLRPIKGAVPTTATSFTRGHRGAATILTAMVTKLMWMRVIVLAVKGKS